MKICPKCAAENADTAKFCNECGNTLNAVEEPDDTIYTREPNTDLYKNETRLEKPDLESEQSEPQEKQEGDSVENTIINVTGAENPQALEHPQETTSRNRYYLYIVAAAIALLILFLFNSIGHNSTNKNKYYITPRKDYTITDSDFDYLDQDLKERISALMQASVDWYNSVEYKDDEGTVSLNAIEGTAFDELGSDLLQDKSFLYDRRTLSAVTPATSTYGELSGYIVNNERTISMALSEGGENEYEVHITPDEWMKLHDDLQNAMDFYYGNKGHDSIVEEQDIDIPLGADNKNDTDVENDTSLTNTEDDAYSLMTSSDKKEIEDALYAEIQKNSILSGGSYNISVDQEEVGEFSIIYARTMEISKEDYLDKDEKFKNMNITVCGMIIDKLVPIAEEYENDFGKANFEVVVGDNDGFPVLMIDKDKTVLYHYGEDVDNSDVSEKSTNAYKSDSFGNLLFETPSAWIEEPMEIDDESKEYMRGVNIYSPSSDDEASLIQIHLTEVDWSVGVKKILDTGINGLANDDDTTIQTVKIDGVKSYFINYQTEFEGKPLYQKAFVFPCSEEEVAILLLATENKDWPDSLDHFVDSIHFENNLPSNLKDF